MDNESMDFDAFFSAFGDTGEDGGNQTDTEQEAPDTAETSQEPDGGTEDGENSGEESTPNQEEKPEDRDQAAQEAENPPQKFTIKVNKQTREVELPEMTELAQKGADYDRVKGQLETAQGSIQALQKQVDEQGPIYETLKLAAEDAGVSVSELVESIHVGMLKGRGMTEAEAKAEIRAAKAEKAMNDLKNRPAQEAPSEDPNQERAKREIAEFQEAFPGVNLSQEELEKLAPDVQKGMTLTSAYLKMENKRLSSELAEEKRKLEAEKQNQKNKQKAAPGQTDSGGGRTKDSFDEFFNAFER